MCVRVLSNNNDSEISHKEAEYLLKFKEAVHNLPSNWFDNDTVMCDWVGVVCGYFPATNFRYIEKIQLNSRHLNGTIPSDINKSLVNLRYFDLGNNSLSGHLPSFSNLSYLQYLYLSYNNFISIPHDCLCGLENLELFDLRYNTNLSSWTFPTNLNTNSRLTIINLENTNLIGLLAGYL
ncbi:hypothetical protein Ahy_A07g035878 [Arachis hypogaea]|uniref:Leucine-rich repeat-containing N-terminal plant-type domain-containing protein n=1 Tax=Arachis hypogaea TaxID=3818 RepID=A0A445CEM3_ARAHY|nr:hypothetical protein Ahy_A07g035878 [Arachis hypogaea]